MSLLILVAGCADAKWLTRSEAIVAGPPLAVPTLVHAGVGASGASARAAPDDEPPNGIISRNEPVAKVGETHLTHLVPEWTIHSADTEEDDEDEEPVVDFGKSARKAKVVAERNRRAGGNQGFRLSLTSMLPDEHERERAIGQSRASELQEGLFALDTSLAFGSAASIQMKTSTRAWDRFVEDDPFRLWTDDSWDWERNGVSDSHVVIGLAKDRLRFTTRYSRSRYTAAARYLRRLAKENGRGDEDNPARFDGRRGAEGDAMVNRLEVDVARNNAFRLSVFGQHSEVDPYYEDIALRDREDDFSRSNERKDQWGGTIGLGPVALTLAQYRSRRLEILDDEEEDEEEDEEDEEEDADDTSRLPRTVGIEAQLAIDLSDARGRLPDMFGDTTWSILPQSVWFGVGRGAIDTSLEGEPQDRTEDWNAGMSWNWDSGYVSISAWQSIYQGGTDLEGLASVWAKFETFPDLSTDLYLSHYRSEYDSSVSLGRFSMLSVTADISKYLTGLPEEKQPSLQLFYRVNYDKYEDRYEADSSSSDALEHIFGMKLQMNF